MHGVHGEVFLHKKCSKENKVHLQYESQAMVEYMVDGNAFKYFITSIITFCYTVVNGIDVGLDNMV